jgi:hypothetical protein
MRKYKPNTIEQNMANIRVLVMGISKQDNGNRASAFGITRHK